MGASMSSITHFIIEQVMSSSFFLAILGYYHPDNQALFHVQYCHELGKEKQLEAIALLMRLNPRDCDLHWSLVAALPPDRAVAHLEKLSQQHRDTWALAIGGLAEHNTFVTDLYLCRTVMHSGSEDARLTGYCAAWYSRKGHLAPLAIVDYLRLRPIGDRRLYPYLDRYKATIGCLSHALVDFTWRDLGIFTLSALLPPPPSPVPYPPTVRSSNP